MKEYALSYVKRFGVVPVRAWGTEPGHFKKPLICNWTNDFFTTPEEIETFWNKKPNANIGIVTGHGFIVLDFDDKPDKGINGMETLKDWERDTGKKLPDETWTVLTGGGGVQMYYATDREMRGFANGEIGVDLRALGSQALVPPSLHYSGRRYQWEYSPREFKMLKATQEVYDFIEYARPNGMSGSSNYTTKRENVNYLNGYSFPDYVTGGRHNELVRLVGKLVYMNLPEEAIMEVVKCVNRERLAEPLTDSDLESTIRPNIKNFYEYRTKYLKEQIETNERIERGWKQREQQRKQASSELIQMMTSN